MTFTPRKLQALLKVHYFVKRKESGVDNSKSTSTETNNDSVVDGYIDTMPGW